MITSPVTIGLCLLLAAAMLATRSAWRDPNNWKIDPEQRKIAFNNWTEMGLFGGVSATVAATLAFWIS